MEISQLRNSSCQTMSLLNRSDVTVWEYHILENYVTFEQNSHFWPSVRRPQCRRGARAASNAANHGRPGRTVQTGLTGFLSRAYSLRMAAAWLLLNWVRLFWGCFSAAAAHCCCPHHCTALATHNCWVWRSFLVLLVVKWRRLSCVLKIIAEARP